MIKRIREKTREFLKGNKSSPAKQREARAREILLHQSFEDARKNLKVPAETFKLAVSAVVEAEIMRGHTLAQFLASEKAQNPREAEIFLTREAMGILQDPVSRRLTQQQKKALETIIEYHERAHPMIQPNMGIWEKEFRKLKKGK